MNSLIAYFGLGNASSADVKVLWPDGTVDKLWDVSADSVVTVDIGNHVDSTPPATIDDLQTVDTTTDSLTITWKAPGDNGFFKTARSYDIRYSTSLITEANFSNANRVGHSLIPKPGLSLETYTITGLNKNTTYYIAIKSMDNQGNISGLSNVAVGKTKIGPTIFNLSGSEITSNSVTLFWTVPDIQGDFYDLRYSSSLITDANWDSAIQCQGLPVPGSPGDIQSYVVADLTSDQTYYFGIKIFENGKFSQLSNILQVKTNADILNTLSLATVMSFSPEYPINVVKAGDVNGDGYGDILKPIRDNQMYKVQLFYGGSPMDTEVDLVFTGNAINSQFGFFTAKAAGDVNGDGYDDIVIGEPAPNGNMSSDIGKAYIYFGGENVDATADVVLSGTTPGTGFTYERGLAGIGDVNHDGYDDVIAYEGGNVRKVFLYFGGNPMDSSPDIVFENIFWINAINSGDLNGDGNIDLVITTEVKNILIYYGTSDSINTTPTYSFDLSPIQLSYSIGLGDINGDGYDDLSIGTTDNKAFIYFGGPVISNVPDIIMEGQSGGDNFGYNVECTDINNDGISDLIVSAHSNDDNGPDKGKVYIFLGGTSFDLASDAELILDTGYSFGYMLSGVGDINEDGYSDIAISNYEEIYIYLGKDLVSREDIIPPGTIADLTIDDTLPGQFILTWTAPGDSGYVGKAAFYDIRYLPVSYDLNLSNWTKAKTCIGEPVPSQAGTENKFIVKDLIPDTDYNFAIRAYDKWGNVSEISNVATGRDAGLNKCKAPIIISGEPGSGISSVVGEADFNKDGRSDLLIGDQLNDAAKQDAGAAFIYFGGDDLQGNPSLTILGTSWYQNIGKHVTSGDLNGDGFDDAIIADDHSVYVYYGGSSMDNISDLVIEDFASPYLVSGLVAGDFNGDQKEDLAVVASYQIFIYLGANPMDNTVDYIVDGYSDEYLGWDISSGDFNKDGFSDLAVGTNADKAYLFLGSSNFDISPSLTFAGGNGFGRSVANAGDLNGDGFQDIAVADPFFNSNSGAVYIYLGASPMDNNFDIRIEGERGFQLGESLSSAGDHNNDGYNDIAIGTMLGNEDEKVYIAFGDANMDQFIDAAISSDEWVEFGKFLSSADDLDQDGYDEIIIGTSKNKIYIYSLYINQPPYIISNPSIPNGTINQPINLTIGWDGGDPDVNDTVLYNVYFGTNINPPLVSAGQSETSFDPGLLEYNTFYFWKIEAIDIYGNVTVGLVWSFLTQTEPIPAKPTNLSATLVSTTQVDLSWDDNSNNESGFKIERKDGIDGNWSQINVVSNDATFFSDTGSKWPGEKYYRIRAFNGSGNSDYSNESFVTIPSLKGDISGNGSVDLEDLIIVLQILSGVVPSQSINLDADVNRDGKIGLAEAIYIIQKVSGLR